MMIASTHPNPPRSTFCCRSPAFVMFSGELSTSGVYPIQSFSLLIMCERMGYCKGSRGAIATSASPPVVRPCVWHREGSQPKYTLSYY
ncbi:unnamed protein product [Periconia digitata]|uniref:Uncharacterized protein n=1 Tax=Periconia digitata TaxID=1303443 RepID=A0A9W4UJA1_9PLEO|nr:unnamed protein product [Periconia digitata]